MSAFTFTYDHKIKGLEVAEYECRCVCDGRTGAWEVFILSQGDRIEVEPDEYFKPLLERHVANRLRTELHECQADAACGVRQYDREMAKEPV